MHVPVRHTLRQGPLIAALVRTAAQAARARPTTPPELPGPEVHATVPPRSPALVRDYLRHVGASTASYRGELPPHLFPQWGFPLLARTLDPLPYDLTKVLNGGCRMEIHRPLPARERLSLRACLEHVDDNGSRAVIRQRLVTGTPSEPEALTSYVYAIVPLGGGKKGRRKEKPRVPIDQREVGRWRLGPRSGLEFAVLTGDFNPVHWVPPYAKLAGFRSTILHGFSTLARAIETLNRSVFAGDVHRLATVDVRFTRPLTLPAEVGVYVGDSGAFSVGDAPGGPAYLTGTFTLRDTP